jgi:hypothetical protein
MSETNTIGYYHQVYDALDDLQRQAITGLLMRDEQETTSPWQGLKRGPRHPTTKRIREPLAHARWLQALNTARHAVDNIPETTLQRFADEARGHCQVVDPASYSMTYSLRR